MTQIIDAYLGLTALRQAGYRSTATAVAELVDNSIEAEASRIDIIAMSSPVQINTRVSNQVQKIAVLDNGGGMPPEILSNCLSLGWGTRLDESNGKRNQGLGRFGFGLKGSSISQARRVEVYSWISKNNVYRADLDLDLIHSENLQVLNKIEKVQLPNEICKYFGEYISETGTLVVWDDLDQMDLKKAETLTRRINQELCRIYRHFLDDDDTYGEKRDIWIHMLNLKTGKINSDQLKANDPLYLLYPNNLPGYQDKATNELWGEEYDIEVPYNIGSETHYSKVHFRFSVAYKSIQKLGGNSEQGKHYAHNTGISFVRAGREIDFGDFRFIDRSEPRHRWWGAEVRFEPVLDELFGVTNNKQAIRSIRKVDDDTREALIDAVQQSDHKASLILEIDKLLDETIKEMMKVIKGRGEGSRRGKRGEKTIAGKVNDDVRNIKIETESGKHASLLDEQEKIKERVDIILTDDANLSEEEALEVAVSTIDYKVDISTDDWPGPLFLDRRLAGNASVGVINRGTNFYEDFWRHLSESDDKKGFEALNVIMMALIRAEDELVLEYDKKTFEEFRNRWGSLVEKLIQNAGS